MHLISDWRYVVWFVVIFMLTIGLAIKSIISKQSDDKFAYAVISLTAFAISIILFFHGFSK